MFTRSGITAAVIASGAIAAAAGAQGGFSVRGYVYDFQYAHPDFGLSGGALNDPSAGLVALTLDANGRPEFNGGSRVHAEATDSGGENIAMHLVSSAITGVGAYVVSNTPSVNNNPTIDSYDPSLPYGGTNVFPPPSPTYVSPLPSITPPWSIPLESDWNLSGKGTTYIDRDIHVQEFTSTNQRTFIVQGERTIVVSSNFLMRNKCRWEFDPGASLTIWIGGDFEIDNQCHMNANTKDPSRLTIMNYGTSDMDLGNNSTIYGAIQAPQAKLIVHNSGELFGGLAVQDLEIFNGGSAVHFASGGGTSGTCYNPIDSDGQLTLATDNDVTSVSTFDEWFRDVPGVNASKFQRIGFAQVGGNLYRFENNAFDPANGDLYGNEGMSNNGNFTMRVDAEFDYSSCGGQYIEVEANCDVWVFVNGDLAIDLGGHSGSRVQRFDMDRFDLTDGQPYPVKVYMASRDGATPSIRVDSNFKMYSTFTVNTPLTYNGD